MSSSKKLIALATIFCALLIFSLVPAVFSQTPQLLDPKTIPKFVNQLTGPPPVYTPTNITDNNGNLIRQEYTVKVAEFTQQMLPATKADGSPTGFAATKVWGYQAEAHNPLTGEALGNFASTPGCTFEAIQGVPVQVKWVNNLLDSNGQPLKYLVPVDTSIHWANPNGDAMDMTGGNMQTQIPPTIVTHLHGGEVPSTSDGHPDAWWTADGKHGSAYNTAASTEANSAVYVYPNGQPPATLWYHDHALGLTRLNVLSGLAGFYLLRNTVDSVEKFLPSGEFEVPLAIQDRSFYPDGSLYYPTVGNTPAVHPQWQPSFLGNTIIVNGLAWPNMDVKQGLYRLRILDGSNSRFYDLSFSNGMSFTQIGSDGGYLKAPVESTSKLIALGERIDILVDFSNVAVGEKIVLRNTAEEGNQNAQTTGQIMQFTVVGEQGFKGQDLPSELNPTLSGEFPTLASSGKQRILTLTDVAGASGTQMMLLDGQEWSAPITETPTVGSTEDWVIVNPLMEAHPIHLHLVQFQIVSRQTFNIGSYLAEWSRLNGETPFNHTTINVQSLDPYLTGTKKAAAPSEQGWKDTVIVNTGEVVTIRIRWTQLDGSPYAFDATAGPGYVWHCHMLEHEDNEMMRPYVLVAAGINWVFMVVAAAAVSSGAVLAALVFLRRRRNRGAI
ncbi:MAG: multicopper oxidase [Candidatus Bathyarchaeota archaeon]|nr:multicopper oxidase [Candidatus Bathyarchaeota archaeon]